MREGELFQSGQYCMIFFGLDLLYINYVYLFGFVIVLISAFEIIVGKYGQYYMYCMERRHLGPGRC